MTARSLVLVRHAKALRTVDVPDVDRPLAARGQRDARKIGAYLLQTGALPDLVLCSTSRRTRETWQGAVEGGAHTARIRFVPTIYLATVPELLTLVRGVPDDVTRLMLIGHSPGIPGLVDFLAQRQDTPAWAQLDTKFPTSAVAVLSLTTSWAQVGRGRARLTDLEIPRG